MLCEPFIPGRKRALEEDDESVSQFVQRRLGGEVLHKVVQPLVGGIFNNDVSKLSARMCLSKAYALEERYGSIILGLIESQRLRLRTQLGNASTAVHSQFVTLDSGLQLLTDEVVRNLKNVELILGRNVESVYNISPSKSTGYRLVLNDQTVLDADCLVFATPAPIASKLTKDLSPPLSLLLARINYASPVVINRIYAHKIAESLPNAFGFILPKSENSNLAACTLTSFKFPQFSGQNKFLLRCFISNEWHQKNAERADADIDRVIDTELAKYLGIKMPAEESLIIKHQAVSPQFSPGHLSLVKGIERELSALCNVFVVGNAYNGSNISDCIERSRNTAEIIFSKIQKMSDLRLRNS
jgi:oxygen-dependent protoporphyrinogen oxidase